MSKIAIFSDVHGNLQALTSILEDVDKDKFDEVICLGDIVGIGPNSKECLSLIMGSTIKMVKGNHEVYQVNDEIANKLLADNEKKHRNWIHSLLSEEELSFIYNLPMYYEKLIDGKLFTFSHFILNENKDYFEPLNVLGDERIFQLTNKQETDYMFIGHSHDAFQIHNNTLLTCVGSSGCRKNNTTFYTILEVDGKNVRITKKEITYDRKSFEKELKENEYPDREKVSDIFYGIKINNH